MQKRFLRAAILAAAALCAIPASFAVRLDPQGLGQALIYPYYTVRAIKNNTWNTLVSVANTRYKPKVVKVRMREALHGRIVEEFNLYLGPYDMWTAAIVPTADGKATLFTNDASCTDPASVASQIGPFSTDAFSGAAGDGAGTTADRTLEGYIEMIEMGTLGVATADAVSNQNGTQRLDCDAVRGAGKTRVVEAPEGGLSGGAYLINVNSGLASSYRAVALAELTKSAFYSDVGQPGTDFDSPQVTPVSVMTVAGNMTTGFGTSSSYLLRSTWSRGVDAVSALFMTSVVTNEYVLDAATGSNTDWAMVLPTARFYIDGVPVVAPFTSKFSSTGACEPMPLMSYNRDQTGTSYPGPVPDYPEKPPSAPPPPACWSANIVSWTNGSTNAPFVSPSNPSLVFGSSSVVPFLSPTMTSTVQDGFGNFTLSPSGPGLTSLATSTAVDLASGNVIAGAHQFKGLPAIGFSAWDFNTGQLNCNGQNCRGTFGTNVPNRSIKSITRVAP